MKKGDGLSCPLRFVVMFHALDISRLAITFTNSTQPYVMELYHSIKNRLYSLVL